MTCSVPANMFSALQCHVLFHQTRFLLHSDIFCFTKHFFCSTMTISVPPNMFSALQVTFFPVYWPILSAGKWVWDWSDWTLGSWPTSNRIWHNSCTSTSKWVTWCFTPRQPLWLYQGNIHKMSAKLQQTEERNLYTFWQHCTARQNPGYSKSSLETRLHK